MKNADKLIAEIIPKKIDFEVDINKNQNLLISAISDSSVLVIGGAGTIGSNYIKEILTFKPKKLVVVDFNENLLTELTRDLRSSNLLDYKPIFTTYPVNLLSDTFDKIFFDNKFDTVANFSAHKHVRSEKDVISIEAMIKNNVYGIIKLLRLCKVNKPKYFFSVSTDKAASPVNIMGASKLLMEKIILSYRNNLRVSTARFANVAFSNGSLLDGFIYRIQKNQPISCPVDIKRFFVTPQQSGQICLLSTFLGCSGDIFFPKLDFKNDQIYFKDIAIKFLKYNKLKPHFSSSEAEAKSFNIKKDEYPVYFFKSDTSGEKHYEEFYTEKENVNLSDFFSLGKITNLNNTNIDLDKVVNDFNLVFDKAIKSKNDIIRVIKKYIDNFNHIEKGKSLDEAM